MCVVLNVCVWCVYVCMFKYVRVYVGARTCAHVYGWGCECASTLEGSDEPEDVSRVPYGILKKWIFILSSHGGHSRVLGQKVT